MRELLTAAAVRAIRYLEGLNQRGVAPDPTVFARLAELAIPLPTDPSPADETMALLDSYSAATMAMAGPRFFGFVIGGVLPAALAANWLASAWDQNAALAEVTPLPAKVEDVALGWLRDVLGLPPETGGGFVTGATMANFACLAAARHSVLSQAGWDVEADGMVGAPEVAVVVGEEAHPTLFKSLGLAGFGRNRVVRVPVDKQGRMRADVFPNLSGPTIVCLQAGNVNTGAFDPAPQIIPKAKAANAWVHVDGAFGLWAAAAPCKAHLMAGYADADSWATDAHKYLNTPYDSGLAFVRSPDVLQAAMAISAAYLPSSPTRDPANFTPELSRRARGIEVWAALHTLGRSGLANLVERTCRYAVRFAEGLRAAGYTILNEVMFNQVLVTFGDDERTRRVIAGIQQDGTCWCGGTTWQGQTAMRISVSSWATTDTDVERSLQAMIRVARELA
ncbi:MAG: aspartate aminotransferase family protein [Ktedonobacter sp. 13_1_20CM_3_54_15]|nr:MAG: aspartate aminotransferase family protein [Ktedonobacter sp. 13_2_20CM_53_11]OLB54016.1 MAG: aspartate aminotransferase family protein [Ktedonobacter sp. 13_2_20CM_2_56_8]OLE03037.1 MAG: aspartate aminotransferase family protein [Ktedonobacter sp. 13_1_20CM_4_53_11]OLE32804.1 MAG: aspartate aminotransferase family protein [Ktedonobacter sp. 13_1_20CM_3_54_15]